MVSKNFLQYIMDYVNDKIKLFTIYYNNNISSHNNNNNNTNNINFEDNLIPAGMLLFIVSMLLYFIDITS